MKNILFCFQISLICFSLSAQDKVGIGTSAPMAKLHITTSIENPQTALNVFSHNRSILILPLS